MLPGCAHVQRKNDAYKSSQLKQVTKKQCQLVDLVERELILHERDLPVTAGLGIEQTDTTGNRYEHRQQRTRPAP